MANYVKFLRGTPEAYAKLTSPDMDTLYFIYKEDETSGLLYLGSKLIAGGDLDDSSAIQTLADLKDVVFGNDAIADNSLLVYNESAGAWVNRSMESLLYIGADEGTAGVPGLVPAAEAGDLDSFLRSDGTWAKIPSAEHTILTLENESGIEHIDLINSAILSGTSHSGDIVIIKDIVFSDETDPSKSKWQHTAYVYGEDGWQAMDGNYNAENVYFNEDILVTTKIGTIQTLTNGQATLSAKGKNVKQVLSSLLAERKNPTADLPEAVINLTNSGSHEVGTVVTPQWKTSFDAGSYTYGPATGVTDAGGSVTSTKDTTATAIEAGKIHNATGSFADYEVVDNVTYKATLVYGWNAGTVNPVDNFGDEYTDTANNLPIQAASNKSVTSSNSITGFRKWFKGGLASSSAEVELTSALIRSDLAHSSGAVSSTTFEMKAADYSGCKRIIIAIPKGTKAVTKVLLKSASNADITSEFKEKDNLDITGYNNYSAIPYRIWVYEPASLDSSEVYTITLG